MRWGNKRGRPPDTRLLEHLLDVSGLPLQDLQFLAAAGLLSTCLHDLVGAGYTPEAWSVALTALCGRPARPEDAGPPGASKQNPYSSNSKGGTPL